MDIFKIAKPDNERTEIEKEAANQRAKKVRLQILGQAVEEGKSLDEARLLADEVSLREKANIYNWYNVTPAEMYPAIIAHIQKAFEAYDQSDGIIRSQYYPAALALPDRAWQLALTPRDEVTKQANIDLRAEALELARVWFTELLHRALRWKAAGVESPILWPTEPPAAVAAPLGLHIEKDERYKL